MPERRKAALPGGPPQYSRSPATVATEREPCGSAGRYDDDLAFSVSGMTPSEYRAFLSARRRLPDVPWETERLTPEQEACAEIMRQDDPDGILNVDGWRRAGGIVRGDRAREALGSKRALAQHLIGQQKGFHLTRKYSPGWMPSDPLPFYVEELQAAMDNKRHRTGEQKLILDIFKVWLAENKPPSAEIAAALRRGISTIERYRSEGSKLLAEVIAAEIRAAVADAIQEERDAYLRTILTAVGIDPVAEAEGFLANQKAA